MNGVRLKGDFFQSVIHKAEGHSQQAGAEWFRSQEPDDMHMNRASLAATPQKVSAQEVKHDARDQPHRRAAAWLLAVPLRTCCLVLIPALLSLLLVLLVYAAGYHHGQGITTISSIFSPGIFSTAKGRPESYEEALNRVEHISVAGGPPLDFLSSLQRPEKDHQEQAEQPEPHRSLRQILADSQQSARKASPVHSRLLPSANKQAVKARKAWPRKVRARKTAAAEAPMLILGEEWGDGRVGSPAAALESLAVPPVSSGSQDTHEKLSKLLAVRNISVDDPDACGKLMRIPKVAIMFLTKGELFHEASWAIWFQHAAGVYPLHRLMPAACSENCSCDADLARAVERVCAPQDGLGVLRQQHLYSVYIHRLPSSGNFPEDSIFAGREIDDRVEVEWGSHELVDAARNLLRTALREPLNQKFIMLSESGIPLYPPAAVHQQLMAEDKSRMDSCGMGRTDPWRYSGRMGANIRHHWRKSSQWVALTRKHAQLIVDDTEFYPKFQEYCHNAWDSDYNRWRDCFSDEHLFPSLIAYLQLGHETDCVGGLVSVDWSWGGSHPKSYRTSDIEPSLFARLREGWQPEGSCNSSYLLSTSEDGYARASTPGITSACIQSSTADLAASKEMIIGYDCPLFARKFPEKTASALYNMLKSCEHDLSIANNGNCTDSIPEQRIGSSRLLLEMHEL